MRVEGHLRPSQARSSISFPFDVAPGAGTLTVRLRYAPDRVTRVKNLVTLSLFDPGGFRGAGHRHATEQTVLVSRREATPGFVPGPITAGTWTIELDLHAVLPSLRRGVEYALEVETAPTVADDPGIDEEVPDEKPVEPGRPDEPSPQPSPKGRGSREPSLGGRGSLDQEPPAGWLKGDVHVHSNHSDARWSMDDLVEHIRQHRLDFVALTDHNTVTGRDALRRALRRAGLDPVVIDGMELTTYWGHANALGVDEWIDWRVRGPRGEGTGMTTSMGEAAEEVHRQGGLFVVNHPRSAGYPWCTGCRWEYGDETPGYADAVEVLNGAWPRHQNEAGLALWDRWLNAGHRIPATAGTDSHGFARQPELLGFTYVRAGRSAAEILEAIKAGRSYLSRGPSIVWLEDDGGLGVRVTGVTRQLEAGLVADGRRRKREAVAEDGEVRFERPSARWYRAELYERGAKVPVALTNPAWPTADETNQGRRETTRAGRPE